MGARAWILRALLTPLKTLFMRLAVASNPRVPLEGLELVDLSHDSGNPRTAECIRSALHILARNSPSALEGVKRRLRRIIITNGDVAYYTDDVRGAVIGGTYLERCGPTELALLIVHEATHARLYRARVRSTWATRERIERICINAELAVARKLPGAEHLVQDIEKKAAKPWWTPSVQGDRLATAATASNAPGWLVRLVRRLPNWTDDHGAVH